jgi:hypothetical protein
VDGIYAETYLRRCAEDDLRAAARSSEGQNGRLVERLRAVAFVGLLDRDIAAGILAIYGRAAAMRGLNDFTDHHHHHRPPAQSPGPVRVAGCTGEVEVNGSIVVPRLAVLGEQSTRLSATIRIGAGKGSGRAVGRGGGSRAHRQHYFDVHEIALRDDKGRKVVAQLSGGGGGNEWRGWYATDDALSRDTEWLEVEGVRLTLHDAASPVVPVETYDEVDSSVAERATRYLRHCSRITTHRHYNDSTPMGVIVETLVACGALAADSAQVSVALSGQDDDTHGHGRPIRHPGGRAATDNVLVGATFGPLDGLYITVAALERDGGGFAVEIDGHGGVDFGPGDGDLDTPRLAIDATDDLGNAYHSSLAEFSTGSEGFSGTVAFEPTLADDATSVDLAFSTERARAVVHVALDPDGQR